MGVSTGEPPAQVGSRGEQEGSRSSVGVAGGCHVGVAPVGGQSTLVVLLLLALLPIIFFPGGVSKGREQLEAQRTRYFEVCFELLFVPSC